MNREPTAEVPNDRPSIMGAGWSTMRNVTLRARKASEPGREMQGRTESERRIESTPPGAEPVDPDDLVLDGYDFLKELQRELRRADRTKAPLSIALFHYAGTREDEIRRVAELLALFSSKKRETDTLGDLGDHTIALILPDTNSQGAQLFAKRVETRMRELQFSLKTATYPDDLFNDLLKGRLRDLSRAYPLFVDRRARPDRFASVAKRCIDVVGATMGIVMLSPVMLATAAAIALTSPGPIIYRQIRLGKGGVPFTFYKFRSMGCNLGDGIHREYVINLIHGGQGSWTKLQTDPRVTPVGRFIRRTSIDELPQLFNVLKGQLSLIGPRPALTYEAEEYQSWHLRRILEVKPGVSGLWQVEGGSKVTFDDMVRLDLQYVRTRSLMLDLRIMVKTIQVVMRRSPNDMQ